jgi:hypothetical protein
MNHHHHFGNHFRTELNQIKYFLPIYKLWTLHFTVNNNVTLFNYSFTMNIPIKKIFIPMSSNINYTSNMYSMIKHNPNTAGYFMNVWTSVWGLFVLRNRIFCTPTWLTKLTLLFVWMNITMTFLKTLSFFTPRIRHSTAQKISYTGARTRNSEWSYLQ